MSANIEDFVSVAFTFPGFIVTAGAIFLIGVPSLGLYYLLHEFRYSWTESMAKFLVKRIERFQLYQDKFFSLISKILTGLIMVNGIIAMPHTFRIWAATARALDHNSVVLITTAAAYLTIKYPGAHTFFKRLQYLQSKTRSELSQRAFGS